jgi:hypothetical protein
MTRGFNYRFIVDMVRPSVVDADFHVEITDSSSRQRILAFTLTPNQFADLVTSRNSDIDGVPGWLLSKERFELIGKHMVCVSRTFRGETRGGLTLWADQVTRFLLAGTTNEVREKGGGYGEIEVLFRHRLSTEEEAKSWKARAQEELDSTLSPKELADSAMPMAEYLVQRRTELDGRGLGATPPVPDYQMRKES